MTTCRPGARIYVAPLLFLLLTLPVQLYSQDQPPDGSSTIRVHVLPTVNRTGEAQFEAVATTVTDTVALTLRLLGRYRISEGAPEGFADLLPLPASGGGRAEVLAEIAASLPAENIVFGEVVMPAASGGGATPGDAPGAGANELGAAEDADANGAGVPELILSVYDRLEGRVVLTERRRPQSLFDIFGATDEITAALLTSFSGRRVAFGSIRIAPTIAGAEEAPRAEAPEYTVTLDGQPLGRNLRSIDSIITGAHRLTVTAEIDGERRTIYDDEIMVQEGGTTQVPLLLPNVAVIDPAAPEAEAARAPAEAAEQRLAEALAALAEERRNNQYTLAQEYYLAADSFIDPVAIREAARENAAQAAEFEITRGQRLLSEREWERGVASHQLVAQLGWSFDSEDLFGYQAEVGLVARNWAEREVQGERRPLPIAGLGLIGFAQYLASWYWDADSVAAEPKTPLQQGAFTVPLAFGAGFLALWNSLDWDRPSYRRELLRYSRDGDDPGLIGWRPRRWELSLGARAQSLSNYWVLDLGAYEAFDGLGTVSMVNAGAGVEVAGRYWIDDHHAIGFGLVPQLLDFNVGLYVEQKPPPVDYDYAVATFRSVNTAFLDWTYTRTGRAYVRAGLDYTRVQSRLDDVESEQEEGAPLGAAELMELALYGGNAETAIDLFGLRLGSGLRFGRRRSLPWELGLFYRLEMIGMNDGTLSGRGLLYGHSVGAQLSRAFRFGSSAEEAAPLPAGPRPFGRAEEIARERWEPLPLVVRLDGGGIAGIGPFLGAEWLLTERLSVGFLARLSIWMDYGEGGLAQMPNVLFPGLTGRYYFSPQKNATELRGIYLGGSIEYHDYARGAGELIAVSSDEGDGSRLRFTRTDGGLFFLMAEGGYRLPLWRSAFLEIGIQAGWALGRGRRETDIVTEADGTPLQVEFVDFNRIDSGPRISPVLAFGTRLY